VGTGPKTKEDDIMANIAAKWAEAFLGFLTIIWQGNPVKFFTIRLMHI